MRQIVEAITYLARHKVGRMAMALIAIGMIGLTMHYWSAMPLLLAMPPRKSILG